MKIKWQVEDGYVGKSRPQKTEIDDSELADCETWSEAEKLISDAIQEDFSQKIYPKFEPSDLREDYERLRSDQLVKDGES